MWYFSLLFLTAVKDHTQFFLADFQWNILRDSININNFNCNPVVLKKILVKPLTFAIFGPNLPQQKGQYAPHTNQKTNLCAEIAKADLKL